MVKPVQEMQPAQLLQEFRDRIRVDNPEGLDPRIDLLEQEILRRMAW